MLDSSKKPIGLIGGTSWPSTQVIYEDYNREISARLGGLHSADLILRSVDYEPIKGRYLKGDEGWEKIADILRAEIERVDSFNVCCIAVLNNTLHKAIETFSDALQLSAPLVSIPHVVGKHCQEQGWKDILFLGTKFTMEDGFFARSLERDFGIRCSIPNNQERSEIQTIQSRIAAGQLQENDKLFFDELISRYQDKQAVALACTELPLAAPEHPALPIIDPAKLQMEAAFEYYFSQ